MRNESAVGSRRRARVIAALVAGVLALTGVVAIGVGVAGQEPAPPSAPSAAQPSSGDEGSPSPDDAPSTASGQAPSPSPSQGNQDQQNKDQAKKSPEKKSPEKAAAQGLDYSEPTSLSIPAINASSSSLEDLTLNSDGVMTTPDDPDKAGWFTPSPPPGVHGVSVITGHVTWNEERGVFFRLGELRKGDRVEVTRKDGVTAVFEVTRIGEFDKDKFPTQAVYGQTEYPALRLITCGGAYDEASNNYLSNVIVWARLVDSVKA